jgi:hypothetical protein
MGALGEALCHEGDHGPQDHGFVAGGQVLVVAGGAPVAELVADAYRVIAPKRLAAWLNVGESGTLD